MNALVTFIVDGYGEAAQMDSIISQTYPHKQVICNGSAISKQGEIIPGLPCIWEPAILSKQQIIDKYKGYTSHLVFVERGFWLAPDFTKKCLDKVVASEGFYKVVYTDYKVSTLTMYMEPFARWKLMQVTTMEFGPMLIDRVILDPVKYEGTDLQFMRDACVHGMLAHLPEALAFTNG